jgi:small subunit ribosomal protein S9
MDSKEKKGKYFEAIGRRKTSTARVRIYKSTKTSMVVNERELKDYFKTKEMQKLVLDPIAANEGDSKWEIEVKVMGGGIHSQSEAVRHGLSRAIVESNAEFRPALKELGFLKRDARAKERRKFGLKKARKAPKWSKR